MVTICRFVLDTSYLLELFAVDGYSGSESVKEVRARVAKSIEAGSEMFVPMPVLFELANHIADVKHADHRKKLVEHMHRAVTSSIKEGAPWIITPPGNSDSLQELMEVLHGITSRFATEFAQQKLGLTDTAVIMEAERLKKSYPSSRLKNYLVHIWTRHAALKAYEPDVEPNPFI